MFPLIAPLLANGLSLLAGGVLKKGTDFVKEKTGIDLADPSISGAPLTPENLVKLKELESSERLELEKIKADYERMGIELEKMNLEDVKDARDMQKEALKQEDLFSKRFVYYFATLIFTFGAVYIFFVTFGEIPKENQRLADTILGVVLGNLLTTIVQFFFGSSHSGHEKNRLLHASIPSHTKEGGENV